MNITISFKTPNDKIETVDVNTGFESTKESLTKVVLTTIKNLIDNKKMKRFGVTQFSTSIKGKVITSKVDDDTPTHKAFDNLIEHL